VLNLVHGDGRQFSTEDIALISSMSDHFGVVIENGRLRQQNQNIAVVQERERLARELHDSVTQSLYSLTLFAEASSDLSRDGNGNSEKLREYLGDISTTAQQALKEMRLLLYELGSGALGEEGLVGALQYRLEAVEGRSGMVANIKAPEEEIDMAPEVGRALYLVAQEALNNTLKHAKASHVYVTLARQNTHLIMIIEDNGRGFSPESANAGGMGLKTMAARISQLGGNLTIHSLPGVGTKIQLSINLETRTE
jgi:signal transduction histidine kinase